ncbi:MAG: hypothetical protein PHV42_02730 [Candidatus Pacebacteria bacterium]|nr:hypothetical protein [Candidatus Paceibacterota bacterium]
MTKDIEASESPQEISPKALLDSLLAENLLPAEFAESYESLPDFQKRKMEQMMLFVLPAHPDIRINTLRALCRIPSGKIFVEKKFPAIVCFDEHYSDRFQTYYKDFLAYMNSQVSGVSQREKILEDKTLLPPYIKSFFSFYRRNPAAFHADNMKPIEGHDFFHE